MKNRARVFSAAILFSLHLALVSYINNLFLSGYFSAKHIDLLFMIGSAAACCFSLLAPHITKRIGIIKSTLFLLFSSGVLLFCIGSTSQALILGLSFVVYFAFNSTILSLLDIALEHYSPRNLIGNIRGLYLMLTNSAWVVATIANTVLLSILPLRALYLLAAAILLLATIFLFRLEHVFHNPKHHCNGRESKTRSKIDS